MANYTHKRCSEETEALLEKYGYLQRGKLPIDIEILSQKMGHRVHVLEHIYERAGLKGTGFRKLPEDRLEILVDSYHYENQWFQCRFTIAEELAHIHIHSQIFQKIYSPDDRIELERNLTQEDDNDFQGQAKRFGSYILIPNKLFLPFCKDWIDNHYDEIVKDNPQDINDFLIFFADKIHHKLELSTYVIEKTLKRYLPTGTTIIDNIVTNCDKKLISPR